MRPVLLLVAGALLVSACSGAVAQPTTLMDSLCAAIDAPSAQAAAQIFEADVHGPLHTLADETAATDRPVAARLLEAKYGVESAVRGDTLASAPVLRGRLTDLATHVRAALKVLGRPRTSC